MKLTLNILASAALLTVASQGATTISGVVGGTFRGADLATSVPAGSLVMLVVDSGNGFLNLATGGGIDPSLTAVGAGRTITTAQAGLTAGSSFGGDTVVFATTTAAAGQISGILTGVDISSYVNNKFAVVWFGQTPATVAGNLAGQFFGMFSLADWTLPAADSGATFTMSSTDASGAGSYFGTSGATTAAQLGAGGFMTGSGVAVGGVTPSSNIVKGMTLQIINPIPEPSAALLGALGALGLLRRRRI